MACGPFIKKISETQELKGEQREDMAEIFGTFGPSCASREVLEEMFRAGMTGIRLNLSHCDLADSADMIRAYHASANAAGVRARLVIDAQGPELRVGTLARPIRLEDGAAVFLGDGGIPVPAPVLEALEPGGQILLDDGKLALQITAAGKAGAEARVIRGGILTGRKSIKLPGKHLRLPVLTERDLQNIRRASEFGVTGLLQPFVQRGEELRELRARLAENGAGSLKIFAKIETLDGAAHLSEILPQADVIVIARGDLGNDMPLWHLPAVQKEISAACRKAEKPFVVVTQMLASMERSPVPTRAEVNDIFNAVADGAWGVMVTGETAVGRYPVETIRYLSATAKDACRWLAQA